jgi:hypothetical protein
MVDPIEGTIGDPTTATGQLWRSSWHILDDLLHVAPKGGGALLFNSGTFYTDNGCIIFCWGLTSDVVGGGVGIQGAYGLDGNPVGESITLNVGSSRYLSGGINFNGELEGNVGAGVSALGSVSVTLDMACWSITEFDADGCPCQNVQGLGEVVSVIVRDALRD